MELRTVTVRPAEGILGLMPKKDDIVIAVYYNSNCIEIIFIYFFLLDVYLKAIWELPQLEGNFSFHMFRIGLV